MGIKLLQLASDGSTQTVVVEELPSVIGHSGHILTNNGTAPYWEPKPVEMDLSSPPPIGNVKPNTGRFTELGLGKISEFKTLETTTTSIDMVNIFNHSSIMFSSGDYCIQASNSTTTQSLKISAVIKGLTCEWTEFDSIQIGDTPTANFLAATDGSNLYIRAIPVSTELTTFKVTALLTTI